MKYKYAIRHEDGTFWNRGTKTDETDETGIFFFDSAALFELESHAKAQWEVLPYYKAIECKVVTLCIAEPVSVDKVEERGD